MRLSVVLSAAAALAVVAIGSSPEAFARSQGSAARDNRAPEVVTVRDHRAPKVVTVRDHRAPKVATVRDHRAPEAVNVRDHRATTYVVRGRPVGVTATYTPRKNKAAVPYQPMPLNVPTGR